MSWNTKFADQKLRATQWLQKNLKKECGYQGYFLVDAFNEHAMMCSRPEFVGDTLVSEIIAAGPRRTLYQLYGDTVIWDAEEPGYRVKEMDPDVNVASRILTWRGFDTEPTIEVCK